MKLILAAFASVVAMAIAGPTSPDVFEGQPRFDQGDASYYVWHESGKWHVRWVASERGHDFKGVVAAQGGAFTYMRQNDSDKEAMMYLSSQLRLTVSNDRADPGMRLPPPLSVNSAIIRQEGTDRIVFDARTTNNIGGFDFVPDDSVSVMQLDLQFDKKSVPGLVRLGRKAQKATELPLAIALRAVPAGS
jgi:hypothetical protein